MLNTVLFLKTSYEDSYREYAKSVHSSFVPAWDYICITASNDLQAANYQLQLNKRNNHLPLKTKFIIVPDKDNQRVGSGGATLSVIKKLNDIDPNFFEKRVLVIHSGGDSKRVPQYSALGKLFSPVPRTLPDGRLSSLFDEILFSTAALPGRFKSGMVLLSGDVLLLYNPLQVEFGLADAACITFKEKAETGKNHGVFLTNKNDFVEKCLEKYSLERLNEAGAIDKNGHVDIDTGAIYFGSQILKKLYSLISTEKTYNRYVNSRTRLSLYTDLIYPLSYSADFDEYLNIKPEGNFCDELTDARKILWNLLSNFNLKALKISPSLFIHFGNNKDLLNLYNNNISTFSELGWKTCNGCSFEDGFGYNSVVSKKATVSKNSYIESSYVHSAGYVGANSILSYIDIHDEHIPDNVLVHGLKLNNGKFVVRIIGVNDNPKENILFGREIKDLPFGNAESLWDLNVFPVMNSIKEALSASLNVYDIVNGKGDLSKWKEQTKASLHSSFEMADSQAIIDWEKRQTDLVIMDKIYRYISENKPIDELNKFFNITELSKNQLEWLSYQVNRINFFEKLRLYLYLAYCVNSDELYQKVFGEIRDAVLDSNKDFIKYKNDIKIKQSSVKVDLPLRVNFGGGWSDTAPHCLENGGTVLNASIKLNGECPVHVKIDKIKERKIIFESQDMGVYGEFDNLKELQNTGDPYDSFALQKAALISIGLIPQTGDNFDDIIDRLGGGFKIDSEVIGVPKGSGLGTSSILSCAVIKALFEFFGLENNENMLYQTVLVMEQIMSTGGGWQDQIGGATDGFKFMYSKPGIKQDIVVEHLNLSDKVLDEINNRFVLIYTGERRLARNLLRDVIGRYLGNIKESVEAHKNIKVLATKMRDALVNENVNEFIKLYNQHYSESLKIDHESTNSLIDNIFMSIEDLIDAKMIIGAGGGGFVGAFMKKNVTKDKIHNRLKEVFLDFPVDVWESCFTK